MIGSDILDVGNGGDGEAHGMDTETVADCPGGGATTITGAIAGVAVNEASSSDIQGSPESEIWPGGWAAIQDSIGLRWDVLFDPDFPFEFENTLPNFGSIPTDSFPLIRYTGWTFADFTGRGVLVVDGVFDPLTNFEWEGIVLARDVDDIIQGEIDGMLIAGIGGPNLYTTVDLRTDVNYNSCAVYGANESLSYLQLMPITIHEKN